jgi:hypothetical protein
LEFVRDDDFVPAVTSGALFFLVALVVIVRSVFIGGPVGPVIVVLGSSIWVASTPASTG